MGEKDTLTRLELLVMQALWTLDGAASVNDVQKALPKKLAYTTVQTMLNILERKGRLKRRLEGRAYVYSATISRSRAARHAVRDLVERMFGGSADELVMSLIQSRQIDPKRIAELMREMEEEDGGA